MAGEKTAEKRNGAERAAILLLTLGEQAASAVLKNMEWQDVQRLSAAMASMENVSKEEVSQVMESFTSALDTQTSVGGGSDEYIRNVLISALGEEKASSILDRVLIGQSSKGLDALKRMDGRQVGELVRQEHPQIIAIVLSYLDPDQAALVLNGLPEWLRLDVMMRIATLDGIQPLALSELNDIMEQRFSASGSARTAVLGGAKTAANIMNFMDGSQSSQMMDDITKADDQLATRIQDLMFVFDNLIDIDDRGMQELLRGVASDRLLLALKGADERLKEKVFKNMSQRAAEMLKDDMATRGPVKLSDVEAAQKEILLIARKMADAGTLALGGVQGEEYV